MGAVRLTWGREGENLASAGDLVTSERQSGRLPRYAGVIGSDSSQASKVSAVFTLGQAVGRPTFGWLSVWFGRINVIYSTILSTVILSLIFWVNATNAEVLGKENLASRSNLLWSTMVVPSTVSAPVALVIYMGNGRYFGSSSFMGSKFATNAGCVFILRRHQIVLRKKATEPVHESSEEDGSEIRTRTCFVGLTSCAVV